MHHVSDSEIKSTEGEPYTPEKAKRLIYGGRVNSRGIIVKAYTEKEYKANIPECHRQKLKC